MTNHKVLLIGWDAADWKVINPLMEQGLMPNLSAFVNNGVMGNLETLDPPLSPMLWTSIATGKRPYKHGIIGFGEVSDDGKNMLPVTLRHRQCKAVWNILNEHHYKTHVVGWWPSHPAEHVDGIYVSNFYQKAPRPISEPWAMAPDTVWPTQLSDFFAQLRIHPQELTANHFAMFANDIHLIDQEKDNSIHVLSKIIAENATIHAAATYILENEPWDFMAVYYDGIDHFNHAFMKYHPPQQPHISPSQYEHYNNCVTAGYRYHDLMLGRLMQLAGDTATIMLVSDHGFHPDHLRKQKINFELAGPSHEHSKYGIICVKGPNILKDELVFSASVLDVAPTVLQLFDLPSATDMDGKVLSTIFEYKPTIAPIATYETQVSNGTSHIPPSIDMSDAMLQQLIELGYIEAPGVNMEQNVLRLQQDNAYFLARYYMDGNKHYDALHILKPLYDQRTRSKRVFGALVDCYCKLAMYEEALQCLDTVELAWKDRYNAHVAEAQQKQLTPAPYALPADILFNKGLINYHKGEYDKALLAFNQLLPQLRNPSYVHLYLGHIFFNKKNYNQAIYHYEQELELNYDNHDAHYGLGMCQFNFQNFEGAFQHFIDSINLHFDAPLTHFHIGECLFYLKKYDEAAQAYEVCLQQNVKINKARARLIRIYDNHVIAPQRLQLHKQYDEQKNLPLIYIVSGLPRSGTSLMMNMLQAGGMELFIDGARMPDDNNPTGYYEHNAVLQLARNQQWLAACTQRAVKVVAPLLQYLPMNYRYKIIFMNRNTREVMLSQQTMLQRMGKTNSITYSEELLKQNNDLLDNVQKWASRFSSNVSILYIKYTDLINNTAPCVERIEGFVGLPLNQQKMCTQVDEKLYRSRIK